MGIEHSGVVQHCLSTLRGGPRGVKGVLFLLITACKHGAWCLDMRREKSQHSTVLILLSSRGGQPIPTCNGSRFSCMALCLYRAVTVGRVGGGGLRRRRAAVTSHPGAILTYQITSPIEAGWLDC